MEDWHNFGPDYAKTLLSWYENYIDAVKSRKIIVEDKFHRMWVYYLLSCAGIFTSRRGQLWQLVLTKKYYDRYDTAR